VVGYRGKVGERERARELRAQAWTISEIVAELGVSKSSASVWVRDVQFDEATRAPGWVTFSMSTSHACVFTSTSIRDSTSTVQVRSGRP
jgi:hypothetical protein